MSPVSTQLSAIVLPCLRGDKSHKQLWLSLKGKMWVANGNEFHVVSKKPDIALNLHDIVLVGKVEVY